MAPFSLDKLPEPPSLCMAEIRQLNMAFNGLLNMAKEGELGNEEEEQQRRRGGGEHGEQLQLHQGCLVHMT